MKLVSTKVDEIGRVYLPKKVRPRSRSLYVAKIGESLLLSPNAEELKELAEIIKKIMRKKRAEEALKFVKSARSKLEIKMNISPEELEDEIAEAVANG